MSAAWDNVHNVSCGFYKVMFLRRGADMRKAQKRQVEDFVSLLQQAHKGIQKALECKNISLALHLLEQCQEGAVSLGEFIEKTEGEQFATIHILEEYCEVVYQIYNELASNQGISYGKQYKRLCKLFFKISNSVRNDIRIRYEAVFMPYKASMWDCMESVWQAAVLDSDCDVYVVPIPYYDRKADGSLGKYHYEGNDMPSYVPIIHYETYFLDKRLPDVIYIHNPYDYSNYVTSVDPRFYSEELKKYTELLVYIPYYATSGGMHEGQSQCAAYYNVDYIVIQAEKYRRFFDPALPNEKFVPLGSPKFDRVINKCQHISSPPAEWAERMADKKVYFYNTSINGMLGNTKKFLEKMKYVFQCFQGRKDACLVWRPHPLLESTFASMRMAYAPIYEQLKKYYIQNEIGIYDDTPDITNTIALCDVYVGDAESSITSLFGITGKPLFILNNYITSRPGINDWKGEIIVGPALDSNTNWMVTQGNKLYYSANNDFQYRYFCDLSRYSSGCYYARAMAVHGKVYVCPANAQDILVVGSNGVEKRIVLERCIEQAGAFSYRYNIDNYIFLIPMRYPAIVRYDVVHDQIRYIRGYNNMFVKVVDGEWRVGGNCVWNGKLLIASPTDNHILIIDNEIIQIKELGFNSESFAGCMGMIPDGTDIWLLPYSGRTIFRWNPETGESCEYSNLPQNFKCRDRIYGYESKDKPFSWAVFYKNYVIFSPLLGNMFLRLDKRTGKMEEWKPPFAIIEEEINGYYGIQPVGAFLNRTDTLGKWTYRFFSNPDRKLYEVNLETGEYKEIPIIFELDDLREHESGFCEVSEWLQYACIENAFNSLENFLDGNIVGKPFDKKKQIRAYEQIIANSNGSSGEKIHQFVCSKL